MTWAHCSYWVNNNFPCIPKYSRVKYEVICTTAKAWPKLGHATRQWSQGPSTPATPQQNGWKRNESKCCTVPVKVQTSTRLTFCSGTLREMCIVRCTNLKQHFKEKQKLQNKNSSTMMRETDTIIQKKYFFKYCC